MAKAKGSCADVLVVMAKHPARGEVKTRLARRIGADAARELYAAFLRDVAQRFGSGPWRLVWAVHPPGTRLEPVIGAAAEQIDQEGAGLAERMRHCFEALFAGGAARVVMIGADVPHLPEESVRRAFRWLRRRDVVLVPTRDGGYCLVGQRAPRDLFSGIAMGTGAVYEQTLRRIDDLGLRARVGDPSFDVDEIDDLRELADLLRRDAVQLPATAEVLARLDLRGSA